LRTSLVSGKRVQVHTFTPHNQPEHEFAENA
jgi:hypothetical protein